MLWIASVTAATGSPRGPFPLRHVADVALPGAPSRFDYQGVDVARGHLVIAHMSDDSVVIVRLSDGSVVKVLQGIHTPRGVAVADDVGRILVTSLPASLVVVDAVKLEEIGRVDVGRAPDGVAWDPRGRVVAVSDQRDGAVSLIADAGSGRRVQVEVGAETGNVVFDARRGRFWVTVVNRTPPDQLVAVDPGSASVVARIDLPGCTGAHGLQLHPDGHSALVACEGNSVLARVGLDAPGLVTARVGADPDVLAIDAGKGWLYVAAESGELTVFDLGAAGLVKLDSEQVGPAAHSVAVDPATHRVLFPLQAGPKGRPVLRIMQPPGT
jgi:DNA-binding beta-propeller fold protein YncE